MTNNPIDYDYAVHSDFLIHWTGKDIDCKYSSTKQPDDHYSKAAPKVVEMYLRRLQNILTYGLWMTEEDEERFLVGSTGIIIPPLPKCCFTELKLSESRAHSRAYGRLGIGVKRPFLFRRLGRPVAYFGYRGQTHSDPLLAACNVHLQDKAILNFFKPMNSNACRLNYDLYSESEWRILFFDKLLKKKRIVDPRDCGNKSAHEYFKSLKAKEQQKLKYLIPLDGWLAMIIYPSLQVKNLAQWDTKYEIHKKIELIKTADDNGNHEEGLDNPTRGNWPIEIDLDACRHF